MMIPYKARHKAAAGFPRRPPRRRERAAACLADLSRVFFRFRPRLECMEDRTLLSTFLVNTTADSGAGSLRQAILDSNASSFGTRTIDFAIPGQGVQTIAPLSPLPTITKSILIDGFSQPGYAGTPLIELSGLSAGALNGLTITGSDVTVRGLDINSFSQGAGIHVTGTGATGDWIYGNFLGTDPSGTHSEPNHSGVAIDGGASNNLIGTNGNGADDQAERNLLSGNLFAGDLDQRRGHRWRTPLRAISSAPTFLAQFALDSMALRRSATRRDIISAAVWQFLAAVPPTTGIGTDAGASVDDVGEQAKHHRGERQRRYRHLRRWDRRKRRCGELHRYRLDPGPCPSVLPADGVFLAEAPSFNWIGADPVGGDCSRGRRKRYLRHR